MKIILFSFVFLMSIQSYADYPTDRKCAHIAAWITGNAYGLKVVDTDLAPADTNIYTKYSTNKNQTELYRGKKRIIFKKTGSRISHIYDGNKIHIMDGNCNLFQTLQNGATPSDKTSILYDQNLCREIGKLYRSAGIKHPTGKELESKVQNLIIAKNKQLALEGVNDKIPLVFDKNNIYTAQDYAAKCTFQASYEKKLEGLFIEEEPHSKAWTTKVWEAFLPKKRNKAPSSANQ